jgi:hypothetical protein
MLLLLWIIRQNFLAWPTTRLSTSKLMPRTINYNSDISANVESICDDSGSWWTLFKLSWNLHRFLNDIVQISNISSQWKGKWERKCEWANTTFPISSMCNWSSLDELETSFGEHIQHREGCNKGEKSPNSTEYQRRMIIAVWKLLPLRIPTDVPECNDCCDLWRRWRHPWITCCKFAWFRPEVLQRS